MERPGDFEKGVRDDRALVDRAEAMKALWWIDDDEVVGDVNLVELTVGDLRKLVFGYLGHVEDLESRIEIKRGAEAQVTQ